MRGDAVNAPANFLVAGIGASAGGIEALEGFFRRIPSDAGAAFIIVMHLSPDRESLLHEVVARFTPLTVKVAGDGMDLEPNTVYVMPAHTVLSVHAGRLLTHESGAQRERKPIDVFLSTLAVDMGERAAGVILSGGDTDGTLGLKSIKEHGGITLAQVHDGFGPRHADMPDAAIFSGIVDFALPADQLGETIVELARSALMIDRPLDGAADGTTVEETVVAALPTIYASLRTQVGHDFSGYKTRTLVRRVLRRMQILHVSRIDDYLQRLRDDLHEVDALFRDLLINVTNFFRDTEAFEALASQVIPRLFTDRDAEETVRIWIPGCATGEEVYSMAMLVHEHFDTLDVRPAVQIFATDIDEHALAVARSGRYPEPLLESVSEARRRRFFTAEGESFVVNKDIRDLCLFSPHSILRDPPFSRIDLVSCRNLLIYFGADAQNQVLPTFHYALRPGGFLFLGAAENASQFSELFAPVDKRHRIFERRATATISLPVFPLPHATRDGKVVSLVPRRDALSGLALRQTVDQQVLERFAPAHVVVNRDGDVVYFSSRTGKYLETPAGSPTRQLLTMARRELRLDLRTAFRECVESGRPSLSEGLPIDIDEHRIQLVDITVEPMAERPESEPLYLIAFIDHGAPIEHDGSPGNRARDGAAQAIEHELHDMRDRLQSVVGVYETALEELKSSNEELVSVNEELQSTNEELEASREELQSVNEELHTVNVELTGKVDALDRANNDLSNLFESTNVATVFLDRKLVIRSFTPAVATIFNIRPSDTGRPITDLTGRLDIGPLGDDIASVFAGGAPTERRVLTTDGAGNFLLRVGPYQTSDRATRGVVVTFVDVTSMTRSEARQQVLIAELQHRTRNLLTLIQSIAQKTLGKLPDVADFSSRLDALSRVQGLLGGKLDDMIDVRDIVRLEMTALCVYEDRVRVSGPPVHLGFDAVQTFSLALHELATNAVKYGAFATDAGRLDISWSVESSLSGDHLVLEWIESGVSIPEPPTHRGFGSELLERALAFTLRARTTLVYHPHGVACRIDMPIPLRSVAVPKDAT